MELSPDSIFQKHTYDEKERALIERAFALAQHAHQNQKRMSGEPYLIHPLAVASFLADMGLDAATVCAALLHDILEDTSTSKEEIEKIFGRDIAFLVEGVTKLKAIQYRGTPRTDTPIDPHVESLKKMFFAMAEDIRVVLIKLADRYHNMQTLKYQNPEAQKRIALETLEIYAPIAGRLGMGSLKGQLEDLAFPFAYPAEYRDLLTKVQDTYTDRLRYVDRTKPLVARKLRDAGIQIIAIDSRAKRYYSLYQKLWRVEFDTEKIFDLVALRIIVPDIKLCYEALGVLHSLYKPLPGKIKDYIAFPKPNGYQSLHTTIFCEKGRIVEVQIRTSDMHEHAENGIAAHWAYSESGKRRAIKAHQGEAQWVNQLKNTLKEIQSADGLKNLTIDFFKNRIFVFTPMGDIKDLPEGATPIDFAYAIHSSIGHSTQGAKINGKIVPLTTSLQNGDVVDIIRLKNGKPSFDWLGIVKTTHARNQIRSWFRTHDPQTAIMNGRTVFNKELRSVDLSLEKLDKEILYTILETHGLKNSDDLFTKISIGEISAQNIIRTVFKEKIEARRQLSRSRKTKTSSTPPRPGGILIEGHRDMLYKLGKCCAPDAASEIRGYITQNRGITIHRSTCPNIKNATKSRTITTQWET